MMKKLLTLISLTTFLNLTFTSSMGWASIAIGPRVIGLRPSTGAPSLSALGPFDSLVNMNTSSPGTTLTTAILTAGTLGTDNMGLWTLSTSPLTGMTVAAHVTGCGLLGSLLIDGALIPTSNTSQSIAYDHTQTLRKAQYGFVTGFRNVTVTGCVVFGPPDQGVSAQLYDYVTVAGDGGTLAVMQLSNGNGNGSGTQYGVRAHGTVGGVGNIGSVITVTQGGTYWFSLNWNSNTGVVSLNMYDTSGNQVGTTSVANMDTGQNAQNLYIGNNETGTSTATSNFENLMIAYSGQVEFPMGPLTTTLPPVYLVNKTVGHGSTSTSTISSSSSTVTAGTTLLAFVQSENAATTVTGVADSAGNTFVTDPSCSVTLAANGHAEMWYAKNAIGSTINFTTGTFSGASTFRNIVVMQVGGGNTSTPFDVCGTGSSASGANLTTASFSPTTSNGMNFFGAYITAGAALLAGTNYQGITTSASTSVAAVGRAQAPSGAQTASVTQANTSSKWGVVMNVKP